MLAIASFVKACGHQVKHEIADRRPWCNICTQSNGYRKFNADDIMLATAQTCCVSALQPTKQFPIIASNRSIDMKLQLS